MAGADFSPPSFLQCTCHSAENHRAAQIVEIDGTNRIQFNKLVPVLPSGQLTIGQWPANWRRRKPTLIPEKHRFCLPPSSARTSTHNPGAPVIATGKRRRTPNRTLESPIHFTADEISCG